MYEYLLGGTTNFEPDRIAAQQQAAAFGGLDAARAAIRALEGLDLVDPGVVRVDEWNRPTSTRPPRRRCPAHHWGGVARKP